MSTVTEKVKTYGYDGDADLPRSLVDAVQTFSEDLLSIPKEFREDAEIDFEPGFEYGESYARVRITYERPETEQEVAARVANERAHWGDQLNQARSRVDFCLGKIDGLSEGRV